MASPKVRNGREPSTCDRVLMRHPAHSKSREPLRNVHDIKDATIKSPSSRVHAFSSFDFTFSLGQEPRIRLSLEPNHDILPPGASVNFLDENGQLLRSEPIVRHEHRVFRGSSWREDQHGNWTNVGWARVTVHKDGPWPLLEGAFSVHGDNNHIQLRANYLQTKHQLDPDPSQRGDESMVLWRDSEVGLDQLHLDLRRRDTTRACSADSLSFNMNPDHAIYQGLGKRSAESLASASWTSLLGRRQIDGTGIPSSGNSGLTNLRNNIGKTTGCPTTRKVALIGVATDCTYTASFNSSDTAKQNVINQINSASSVYEKTFNISLGLQNLTVSPGNCPESAAPAIPWNVGCGGNTTITDRLNLFSEWRSQSNDSNAYWTLLTNCNTGAEVGLSWLGQLCVTGVTKASGESTSGANVVAKTSTEWQVIAHETGHTFGAVHDCDRQTCANSAVVNAQQCCPLSGGECDAQGRYLMNPSTSPGIGDFSLCTIGNICSAFNTNSVKSSCLADNKGVTTFTGAICGNGIVEAGEDCDCGGTRNCDSDRCCDPNICKFTNRAVCDDSNDDCCQNCQYARNGTVCRKSTGVCDPQETCSGTSATCPADTTAPDGQGCGTNLQCASGQCTSRDLQCKTLMGSYTQTNDTYACNRQDCMLSCASPDFPANECYSMQQNFLDGTTCGGGGHCSNVSRSTPEAQGLVTDLLLGRLSGLECRKRNILVDWGPQDHRDRGRECLGRSPSSFHSRVHRTALSAATRSPAQEEWIGHATAMARAHRGLEWRLDWDFPASTTLPWIFVWRTECALCLTIGNWKSVCMAWRLDWDFPASTTLPWIFVWRTECALCLTIGNWKSVCMAWRAACLYVGPWDGGHLQPGSGGLDTAL